MTKTFARALQLLTLLPVSACAAMSLTSNDIAPGGAIPIAHIYPRCGGGNFSPQLSWNGAPSATKSFVLTMIDVDVEPDQWSHWVVVDLPASANSLPRGAQSLPGNAKAIVSNFGDAAYAGPCPPKGSGVHHYEFTVWALPTATISLAPNEKAVDITAFLSRRALGRSSLIALVNAPSN